MAKRSAEKIGLIRELCQRLGFSVSSGQLESERGLQSLLPLIQARLDQLRDEDTYQNVEEIPTDTCSVAYAAAPLPDSLEPAVEAAVRSIMHSMVSAQAQLMLVAQILESTAHRHRASQDAASDAVVQDTIGPLLAEIRGELLLKELLLTIVRVATGAVGSGCCSSCNSSSGGCCTRRFVSSSTAVNTSEHRGSRGQGFSPSSQQQQRRRNSPRSSTAAGNSGGGCGSSFRGFPCYPSPRTATTHNSSGLLESSAAVEEEDDDDDDEEEKEEEEEEEEAAVVEAAAAAATAEEWTASSRAGHGQATVRNRSGAPSACAVGAVGYGGGSHPGVHYSRRHGGSNAGGSALAPVPGAGPGAQPGAQPGAGTARTTGTAKPAWRSHETEGQLVSYSNMEARWRGRTMVQRRREVYWPVEDAYQYPYEELDVVARDQWQFTLDRPGYCPAYARLNRLQRADMLAQTLDGRRQRRFAGGGGELLHDGSGDAFGPFELYNGVVHPLGPSGAPCRAAFVGD